MPLLFAVIATFGASQFPQDTSISIVAAYTAVLEHAGAASTSRAGAGIVIANRVAKRQCAPFCVDTTFVAYELPAEVVQELTDAGLIEAACEEPERTIGCRRERGRTFIRLGVPYEVRAHLHVLPGEARLSHTRIERGPLNGAEPVHVGLDVVIYRPCPAERSPCEYPNIDIYLYFLQVQPDRSFKVVSRLLTGGA